MLTLYDAQLGRNWPEIMHPFGIAEYPQIFPHGGAAIYVGGKQSMGSRNINLWKVQVW